MSEFLTEVVEVTDPLLDRLDLDDVFVLRRA